MNEEQTLKPQCERPMEAYEGPELTEMNKVESCESKEQREQRRRLEILKRWEISIHVLDRGCFVRVGCKSVAFTSIEAGYKEIGRYLENPQLVATQHGFEDQF